MTFLISLSASITNHFQIANLDWDRIRNLVLLVLLLLLFIIYSVYYLNLSNSYNS